MTTAIVVMLTLLGIGIVIDRLLWLRKWLKNSPPSREDREPPAGKL
ncbi:hypothetical protein [Mycobacterium sp.]|nr:hypothetical protein [Mycobacterium sp.]